jgi:hypothetical protein
VTLAVARYNKAISFEAGPRSNAASKARRRLVPLSVGPTAELQASAVGEASKNRAVRPPSLRVGGLKVELAAAYLMKAQPLRLSGAGISRVGGVLRS